MDDYVGEVAMHEASWGEFLEPNPAITDEVDPGSLLGIEIKSGIRANFKRYKGQNPDFDRIASQLHDDELAYEDQCSPQHYFDLFRLVDREHGNVTRLVDVGVFMGGSSTLLAACAHLWNLELDLVDVSIEHLQFTRERIRRAWPDVIDRVRMFHGDLPTYVARVLSQEPETKVFMHHDGSHVFNVVVKDLSSLYYVKDQVQGLAIQDTHLRGSADRFDFVDAAVYAVWGADVKHEPIGTRVPAGHAAVNPNRWSGGYFVPDAPEGMYVPFEHVEWKYPHPSMSLTEFLPVMVPQPGPPPDSPIIDGSDANTPAAQWQNVKSQLRSVTEQVGQGTRARALTGRAARKALRGAIRAADIARNAVNSGESVN